MHNQNHQNNVYIHKVCGLLALCHTIIIQEKEGRTYYNASSPDELALVNAARHFGYSFVNRDEYNNLIVDFHGDILKYKLLAVLEFTSSRKRMSVILETPEGDIKILCKGADSIILERLRDGQDELINQTNQYLENYAKDGLRTLLLSEKTI
jgi:magnesium-transporting ATPase (P-type)